MTSWLGRARSDWSKRRGGTTRDAVCRSTASPRNASVAPSSTAVRSADWAPRSVRTLARQLDQTEHRLATELGRLPSLAETAGRSSISVAELERLRSKLFRSVVLVFEQLVGDPVDDDLALVDVLADPTMVEPSQELEDRELRAYLRDAIALLPERHRLVITGYFIHDRPRRSWPGSWA